MSPAYNTLLMAALACMPLAAMLAPGSREAMAAPVVIGHRGASGYVPEHTLESYALAIELGADYVEPDVVVTRDGFLIARHEPNLINTTNVKDLPQFAARKRQAMIDGVEEEGFFASDFTLAEIKTLRATQQFGERDQSLNGKFMIPTLDEVIALVKRKVREKKRLIGIYPETKHPTYHRRIGLALEDRLVHVLHRAGWNQRQAPVFIQSFEPTSLRYLRSRTGVQLVQLVDASDVHLDGSLAFTPPSDRPYDWTVAGDPRLFKDMVTPVGLAEVKTYADGIGPWKRYIVSTAGTDINGDGQADDVNGDGVVDEADRTLLPPSALITEAHQAGLLVHAWTFRNEPRRLAADYRGMPVREYRQFYQLGIDGVFSDFPDTAVTARELFRLQHDPGYAACLVRRKANDQAGC